MSKIRIVCISDTHGKHGYVDVPDGDVVIHAGDFSMMGRPSEIKDFFYWFERLPHRHKICIAGNHDWMAERNPGGFSELVPDNVIYLQNESVEVMGLKIWGSPVTPWFHSWAFNVNRGQDIAEVWADIPNDIDVLVTHGPPSGILDMVSVGGHVGCVDLLNRINGLTGLKLHVFGHIHEQHGKTEAWKGIDNDNLVFVNASVLDDDYRVRNKPIIVDL